MVVALLLSAMLLAPAVQDPVVGLRISGPVSVPGGGVSEYLVDAHEPVVLYRARQESTHSRLYSTMLVDGYPNAALSLDSSAILRSYTLTRDGKRVLFFQSPALYVVPVKGGTPIRLSSPDEIVARVAPPLLDGLHAVYSSFLNGVSGNRVRLVALDGKSPPVTLANTSGVVELQLTPDGSHVLAYGTGPTELVSIPLRGGHVSELGQGLLVYRGASPWPLSQPSPDGQNVLFLSDPEEFGRFELFTVPVDGRSAPRRLHAPRRHGESVGRYFDTNLGAPLVDDPAFAFTADGKYVLFFASYRRGGFIGGRFLQLLKSPVDGLAPPTVLTDALWPRFFADEDGGWMNSLRVDPSGEWLTYQTATGVFPIDVSRVFSVPASGGARRTELTAGLFGTLANGVPMRVGDENGFLISADGSRVVFVGRVRNDEHRLYSVPIDGSRAPVEISGGLGLNSDVTRFALAGGRALFRADPQNEVYQLFQVPIQGGVPRELLNAPLVNGGDVESFQTRAGEVIYLADQDVDGVLELYLSTLPAGD